MLTNLVDIFLNMLEIKEDIINFDYFLSTSDTIKRNDYYNGLAEALRRCSAADVVLSTTTPLGNPNTHIILAKNANNDCLGGIRVETKSLQHSLPLEKSKTSHQSVIKTKIQNFYNHSLSIGEICGVWVNPSKQGQKLGLSLIEHATQWGFDLGMDAMICMAPLHTLDYVKRVGYTVDQEIPPMAYPDDRYMSSVAWHIKPIHKEIIYEL